jgi:hypothetical protein
MYLPDPLKVHQNPEESEDGEQKKQPLPKQTGAVKRFRLPIGRCVIAHDPTVSVTLLSAQMSSLSVS